VDEFFPDRARAGSRKIEKATNNVVITVFKT
jgi:hypothetical protein